MERPGGEPRAPGCRQSRPRSPLGGPARKRRPRNLRFEAEKNNQVAGALFFSPLFLLEYDDDKDEESKLREKAGFSLRVSGCDIATTGRWDLGALEPNNKLADVFFSFCNLPSLLSLPSQPAYQPISLEWAGCWQFLSSLTKSGTHEIQSAYQCSPLPYLDTTIDCGSAHGSKPTMYVGIRARPFLLYFSFISISILFYFSSFVRYIA